VPNVWVPGSGILAALTKGGSQNPHPARRAPRPPPPPLPALTVSATRDPTARATPGLVARPTINGTARPRIVSSKAGPGRGKLAARVGLVMPPKIGSITPPKIPLLPGGAAGAIGRRHLTTA
jgi:hypothetical protein